MGATGAALADQRRARAAYCGAVSAKVFDRVRSWLADPARMGGVDRAWLRMDDPTNLMVVNALLLLAEPLSLPELRELVADRLGWIERMRLRVEPGQLWHRWREGELDLDRHVSEATLPDPPTDSEDNQRALAELLSARVSEPLDPERPLWELLVVHNLHDGSGVAKSAVLCRVHHCVGDGLALLLVLLSLTETQAGGPKNPLRELFVTGGRRATDEARRFIAAIMPTGMKLMLHRDHALLAEEGDAAAARGRGRLAEAGRLSRIGVALARDLASLVLRRPDASTVFRGRLVVGKRVAWSRAIELAAVRSLHHQLRATVNDVLLAAMTGALRRYLLARGEAPEGVELRAAVPVNLRGLNDMARLGNRFGLVFLDLPVGLADPRERLAELRRRMRALQHSVEPAVTWGVLSLLGAGPKLVEQAIVSYFAQRVSFVMTNVPGPERELLLAGKAIEGVMFWVPQTARVGLGVSIFSYAGTLRVGVASDASLVPDPERLIEHFHSELEHLLAMSA